MNDINCRMPIVALRGLVIMPDMVLHFDVSRKKSAAALESAMQHDQMIMVTAQTEPDIEDPVLDELHRIGCMARIKQLVRMPKDVVRVLVEGKFRAEIEDLIASTPFLLGDVIIHDTQDRVEDETRAEAMRRILVEKVEQLGSAGQKFGPDVMKLTEKASDIVRLTNALCNNAQMPWKERQKLLEIFDFEERYEAICRHLQKEYEVMLIGREISAKVKADLDKNQKDYVLREQIKVIREELGEDTESEADEYRAQADKLKCSDEVREKLYKEIRRFEQVPPGASESVVYRNYIEHMLEMPWDKMTRDNRNLDKAQKILREDHYGLDKVKERIVEYLAVRLLTRKGEAPVLCLVGPPGTGKTSIARSIARALSKKYVRISLGGVHDEAEIRGHRKTYIGAMPGRIAAALRQAGTKNPVLLLDEIDKVSTSDFKGDTYSALLEVLDGEQNVAFRDNYLEVPLDLSEVLFIATANSLDNVPRPLLDRMEIIEINTYTLQEKLHIAKEHLIEKQIEANGLKSRQLSISDSALQKIILNYTREAGVRNLERCIGEICRKTARQILQDGKKSVHVTERNLSQYLGQVRFEYDTILEKNEIGVVRGLAWTAVGGDTLSVEVNVMPGSGEFDITGQVGSVMRESAMAGISYIRSISSTLSLPDGFFEKNDFHIHIPEGAVPKDGPSAGVTMVTAMYSALTGIPVKADVAMTGEVTLRGRVLPIGGLREKTIAAKVAGIHTVIVPEKNRRDILELSKEITRDLNFVYAGTMADILPVALERMPEGK